MQVPQVNQEVLFFLRQSSVFTGLSEKQLQILAAQVTEMTVAPNDYIIHESEINDEFYIIKEGEAEVIHYDEETKKYFRISTVKSGAVLGEITLIDNAPRSASVRALRPTTLYVFSMAKLKKLSGSQTFLERLFKFPFQSGAAKMPIYTVIVQNIAKNLTERLRTTNEAVIGGLKKELALEKVRSAMGKFLVNTVLLLCIYLYALKAIMTFPFVSLSSTFISIPILILFAAPLILMMKFSGYPLSVYGFTLNNAWRATSEAVLFSLPFMLVAVIYKLILLHYHPAFHGGHLFDMTLDLAPGEHAPLSLWGNILIVLAYLIFVPVQELMARGAMQSSFQIMLSSKHKYLWAIILSNLLFSVTHLHLSLSFAFIVFLPGLFWGWLYARHHTLVGVTVSHLILGAWTIFVVGMF